MTIFPLLFLFAFTTACTTVQTVIVVYQNQLPVSDYGFYEWRSAMM